MSLSGWRLTLPVDASGGTGGTAAVLNPAVLKAPYLLRDPDGSLAFWAPDGGARTPNSQHPRTELVANAGFQAARSGRHTLTATVAVSQVPTLPAPSENTICIGQLHGGGSISSAAFVLIHYRYSLTTRTGTVDVGVEQGIGAGRTVTMYPLLSAVALNTQISYSLTDDGDGTLTVTASAPGSGSHSVRPPVPSAFLGADVRFQAGDYSQSVGSGPAGDGGRMTMYRLSAD